jgi:CBS domain containing-hemolysin-like protein
VAADDPDRVEGFVDVKDLLRTDGADGAGDSTTAGDIARDVPMVPETGRLDDLLAEFQGAEVQMAVVIDEWGVFEGIATVEDVVEEVFGDLRDAFDAETGEPSIERLGDGSYAVDGGVSLSDVNDLLETDFEAEDFGTIGGLVLDRLGRAPEVGDRVEVDGYHLEVERVDGARVSRVVVGETAVEDEGSDGGERPEGDGQSD